MNAVAFIGPMAVNVDASLWHSYESGVFSGCPQTNVDINHVVQVVGYGTDPEGGDYWTGN
jgi:cathepsin L